MNITIINCFDTYEHRVDLLFKYLTEVGHRVTVLTSDYQHIRKRKRTKNKDRYLLFDTIPYYKNISLQRAYSHIQLSRNIFNYVEEHINTINLLWVFVPPNSFVKDAADIKRKYDKIKLIFDFIDLWPESMPINGIKNIFPFTYWKNIRDKHLNSADYIVTECNLYQSILKNNLNKMMVKTLYLARPFVKYIPQLDLPDKEIALCYLGSINNIIDIDCIADIIKKCQKYKPVVLHIIGDGENKSVLVSKIQKTGTHVIDHGIIYDRYQKQRIFDACHYGLNIMKKSVCVGLTMKSIDYFEFGLPIINNIHGDTWDAVEVYNIGMNYTGKHIHWDYLDNIKQRKEAREFFETFLTELEFHRKVSDILEKVKYE